MRQCESCFLLLWLCKWGEVRASPGAGFPERWHRLSRETWPHWGPAGGGGCTWLRSLSVLLQLSTLEPEQASWAAAPLGEHLEPRPGWTGHVTCPPGLACPGLPPRSQAAASTSHRCILGSWEAGSRKQRWPGSFSVPVPETATPNPFSLHMRKQAWVGDWPRSLPLPFTLKPPLLAPEAHWPSKSVFWFLLPH